MARQVAIGSDLYLFHGDEGRSEYLTISAHGGTLNERFIVPSGVALYFYAPADHILETRPVDFRLGLRVEEEVASGATSTDYALSKFQGARRGGGMENYGTIKAKIDWTRRLITQGVQSWDQYLAAAGPLPAGYDAKSLVPTYKSYLAERADLLPVDVLTIRARGMRKFNFGHVKLSAVLRTLASQGIFYPHVFCSFCRYTNRDSKVHSIVNY